MLFIWGFILFSLIHGSWARNKYPDCTLGTMYATAFPYGGTTYSEFYECSNGVAYLKGCSICLDFNCHLDICKWGHMVRCGSFNVTTLPSNIAEDISTTQNPTTDSSISKGPNCRFSDDANVTILFPHETNCSQFYKCSYGTAYLYNCSAGLHFNPILNICDWSNVSCNASTNATTLPTNTSEDTSTTPAPTNNSTTEGPNCRFSDDANVTILLPHETNCSQFYKCSHGTAYLYNCSAGLHFNPILNVCDWSNVSCNALTNTTKLTTNTLEATSTTPTPTNNSTTEGPNCRFSGDANVTILLPHETNCSQFYKCSHGTAYLYNCSAGLHFNPILNVCDWSNVSCNALTNATKLTTTTLEATSTTPAPTNNSTTEGPNCPFPDGKYVTFFPHETNCSQFYKCSNGFAYLYNCPAGLYFNTALNVCDWPQNSGCVRVTQLNEK